MGTKTVKTMAEMNTFNRMHFNRVVKANKAILRELARLNERMSVNIAETKRFSGELVSSIDLIGAGTFKVVVMASAPHAYEIEEGLKTPEFRSYSEYPKLAAWVREKFDNFPSGGIIVGNSPDGVPHPQGLHFMRDGYLFAFQNSPALIAKELRKISFGG